MKSKQYVAITGLIFGTICLGHTLRVMYGWPVTIGAYEVSMGLSWLALFVSAGLLVWAIAIVTQEATDSG
jgi:hypothetical protein